MQAAEAPAAGGAAAAATGAAADAASPPAEEAPQPVVSRVSNHVLFYRTSYKLSEQQLTLPKGVYVLPPGEPTPVQLFVALHPDSWDTDSYVAARANSLQAVTTQGLQLPYAPADDADSAAATAAPFSTSSSQPAGPASAAATSGGSTSFAAFARAAVAASELQDGQQPLHHSPMPLGQHQQQEAMAAAAKQLLWSPAAASSWAQGFGPDSQLLGPFEACAKIQVGAREGMCRISKVQHKGALKGIWHASRHTVVLYERVGVTLIIHLKPRPHEPRQPREKSTNKKQKVLEAGPKAATAPSSSTANNNSKNSSKNTGSDKNANNASNDGVSSDKTSNSNGEGSNNTGSGDLSSSEPVKPAKRKRQSATMYNLPGKGFGRQVYAGSVTEVEVNCKLASNCSGTLPLKLPKALVLSQFKVDALPFTVQLDLVVDGQAADLTVQVQSSGTTGSSSSPSPVQGVVVRREATISRLPRHQSYCLTGLASACLGPYTGYTVNRIAAPGGAKVVVYMSSPAAQAAADAAKAAAKAAAAAAAAAAAGEQGGSAAATAEGEAAGEDGDVDTDTETEQAEDEEGGGGSAGGSSRVVGQQQLVDADAPEQAGGTQQQQTQSSDAAPAAGADPTPSAAAGPAAEGSKKAAAGGRHVGLTNFWLQRERVRSSQKLAAANAHVSAAADADAGDMGDSADDAATTAEQEADGSAAAAIGAAAPVAKASTPAAAPASSRRLDMFKAILQRQQHKQQTQKHKQQQLVTPTPSAAVFASSTSSEEGTSSGCETDTPKFSTGNQSSLTHCTMGGGGGAMAACADSGRTAAGVGAAASDAAAIPGSPVSPMVGASPFSTVGMVVEGTGSVSPQLNPTSYHHQLNPVVESGLGLQQRQEQQHNSCVSGGAAAAAASASRKRVSLCQKSRFGAAGDCQQQLLLLGCSTHQQQQQQAVSGDGEVDAIALIGSKRQKTAHMLL